MIIRISMFTILTLLCSVSLISQVLEQEAVAKIIVDGVELPNALAGGLNAPQLSNADFNNDGVSDVLIFDRIGGAILPMIRKGSAYIFDPSYVQNFPLIKHFLLMKDYNQDGIADIFCHSTDPSSSGISVYKGKYTNDKLDFDLYDDPNNNLDVLNFQLASGSFANIAVLNSDIPSIEDIDGDGDMDVVTFNFLGGRVEYYRNLVVERNESLDGFFFVKAEDCYGGIYESGQSKEIELPEFDGDCADGLHNDIVETRHAGSTVLSLDFDADGDYELILGDLAFNNITLLVNNGDEDNAFFDEQIIEYPNESNEPIDIPIFPGAFYVDIDGDGIRDFVSAPNNINNSLDADNVWYYNNTGEDDFPILDLTSKSLFVEDMFDVGTSARPAFADVNADGLLDMVIGSETRYVEFGEREGRLFLFYNVGTATEPSFELVDDNWLDFARYGSQAYDFNPTFGDLDSDGDLDLFVGVREGFIFHVENNGGPQAPMDFGPIIVNYLDIDVGQIAAPIIYDLDKDGLLDFIVGERNGNINFLKNVGTASSPSFDIAFENSNSSDSLGLIDTRLPGVTTAGFSNPEIISLGGEEYLVTGTVHGALEFYKIGADPGKAYELVDDNLGDLRIGSEVAPTFVDLNNDGTLEAVIGNKRGGISTFRVDFSDLVSTSNQVDAAKHLRLRSNIVKDVIRVEDGLPVDFIVYSAIGQNLIMGKQAETVDISRLVPGVYFIQMERDGLRNTEKFVKQ